MAEYDSDLHRITFSAAEVHAVDDLADTVLAAHVTEEPFAVQDVVGLDGIVLEGLGVARSFCGASNRTGCLLEATWASSETVCDLSCTAPACDPDIPMLVGYKAVDNALGGLLTRNEDSEGA